MSKRSSGFGKPRWKREPEPREIGASAAARKPSGTAPDPVFRDNNEPAGDWQSSLAWGQSPGGRRRRQGHNVRMPSEYLPRLSLTDEQWRWAEPFLVVKKKRGRKAKNLRKTFEGIIWIFRTGAPWRDLHPFFGKWNSVYQAFRRMCKRGAFLLMFMSLAKQLDMKLVMVDGSFVKVHQHAVGARRGELSPEESRVAQAIGKTKGGLNTNLLALADKNGKLARFSLLPGNAFEAHHVRQLLEGLDVSQIEELLGDKAYDTNAVRAMLAEMGIEITIPSKSNRKAPIPYDKYSYKGRHLIENLFVDIKHFRGVSTRYHKLAETFCAGLHLVTWFLRTRGRKGRRSKYLDGR